MRAIASIAAAILAMTAAAAAREHLYDCAIADAADAACRVAATPDIATVQQHLSGTDTAWWRDGDRFIMAARAKASAMHTCCVFQEDMTRLPGTDFWTLTIKSPHLDHAIIDILVQADGARALVRTAVWRGPLAPAQPPSALVAPNRLKTIEFDSPNLGEKRKIAVYLPPAFDPSKHYPVIYMADGEGTYARAGIAEALIAAGKLPPIIIVGLYAGTGMPLADSKADRRNLEYLIGLRQGDAYFLKHQAFLLNEVMPRAEKEFGASRDPSDRILLGQSSGAAWAVDTAMHHPELFRRVIGLSICWQRSHDWGADKAALFLGGGAFEGCRETTAKAAAAANAAGEPVVFETYMSGHSPVLWDVLFADGLAWAWGVK
jgi:enterochelin esterase-like enzyme